MEFVARHKSRKDQTDMTVSKRYQSSDRLARSPRSSRPVEQIRTIVFADNWRLEVQKRFVGNQSAERVSRNRQNCKPSFRGQPVDPITNEETVLATETGAGDGNLPVQATDNVGRPD